MEPTPTPSPSAGLDPTMVAGIEVTVVTVVIGIVLTAVALIIFSALIVRSARYDMPVPLIAPLSLLALTAMILGAIIGDARELIAVASAAVGALAASLTAVFNRKTTINPVPPADANQEDSDGST